MRQKLTVTIEGDTETDLGYALDEVRRLVASGYLSGFDSNDEGSYSFEVEDAE